MRKKSARKNWRKKNMEKFDVIIIGGGPGGCRAARLLAEAGKSVALISDNLGGECLHFGCIPTKTYLWSAELFEKISMAADFGIDLQNAALNWPRMQERRREVVSKLQKGLRFTLDRAGVKIIEGCGKLVDSNTVWIASSPRQTSGLSMTSDFIILATGSEAFKPAGFENALTNHEILDLKAKPETLLIIGGGAVGVEFASIFAALGTKVTIAERAERLLPNEDSEISRELERVFARKNISILKNTAMAPEKLSQFQNTLVAVGRRPTTKTLGLENAGVRFSDHGVETNNFLQTNIQNIFAIGDVAGKMLLAYSAEREAEIAAQKILGKNPEPVRYETVPSTIFSLPEVASVGISEDEAKKRGLEYAVGKAAVSANAKALILGSRDGFAKIIIEKKSGKILGVHIIGEKATELIAEASLALTLNLTLDSFEKNIHSHPILGEILRDACEACRNMLK